MLDLQQLKTDVQDIFLQRIETTRSYVVPSRNDSGLTFPIGDTKKGKFIETCVLFVDIRNSTTLSKNLGNNKILLGKIYSAFIHSMTSIADEFGYVRNIIGDRVMVVFEPNNCFENAMRCAAVMFGVAREIIATYCKPENFKVGIGIDFGELLILKTGIRKKHEEQSEYKNLVWIGDAANIASKLTDFANKQISVDKYKITYTKNSLSDALSIGNNSKYMQTSKNPLSKLFESIIPPSYAFSNSITPSSTEIISLNDLYPNLFIRDGIMTYKNKRIDNLEKFSEWKYIPPILMSGKVFQNFRKSNPKSTVLKKFVRVECTGQPNTGSGIFGGGFTLNEIINN